MTELSQTLKQIGVVPLFLAFTFLIAYALALGGMLGHRGKWRAAWVALLTAVAFATTIDPWVHAVILTLFAVAGVSVFIAAAWLLITIAQWAIGVSSNTIDNASMLDTIAPSVLSGEQMPTQDVSSNSMAASTQQAAANGH